MKQGMFTCALLLALSAAADVPDLVSYQGRLLDSGGQPVTAPTQLRFRLYLGGDDLAFPSTGMLVYEELATVAPSSGGVFSHLIGSGTPDSTCAEIPCALTDDDVGDGALPVWIEVMVDPDGASGSSDDDVLLPRTRVGSVGFAYRVAAIDGAAAGQLVGELSVDSLVSREGATLGDGATDEVSLSFDGAGTDAQLTWDAAAARLGFSRETSHAQGLVLPDAQSIAYGPFLAPVSGAFIRLNTTAESFADGNLDGTPDPDHVFAICYNCAEGSSAAEDDTEYAMKAQWEMTFAPADGERAVEHNWNFLGPGQTNYRPYQFFLDTDFGGGYANPTGRWDFRTDKNTVALHLNQNGNVKIGGTAPQPTHRLEVVGSLRTKGAIFVDAAQSLQFGGRTALTDTANNERLIAGNDYKSLGLQTNGADRVNLTASDVKIADASGSAGASLVLGVCADTASAASVNIANCNVVTLTGSTEVNQLSGCDPARKGRFLYLLCGAAPVRLCDGDGVRCSGGNLRLSGSDADFTCSPDDVVPLVCDGTNWRQSGPAALN